MRLDPGLVHPLILDVYETHQSDGKVGERQELLQVIGLIAGAGLGWYFFTQGLGLFGSISCAIAVMAASWIGFSGNTSNKTQAVSITDLAKVFDQLSVEDTWEAYVDTLVALDSANQEFQIEETISALNALLTEEAKLQQERAKLAHFLGKSQFDKLEGERRSVVLRMSAVRDEAALLALTQSLALIDERLAGRQQYKDYSERIGAQIVLVKQTILSTRDAAQRLQNVPFAVAADSLRTAIAAARAQTQETERALAELRAI